MGAWIICLGYDLVALAAGCDDCKGRPSDWQLGDEQSHCMTKLRLVPVIAGRQEVLQEGNHPHDTCMGAHRSPCRSAVVVCITSIATVANCSRHAHAVPMPHASIRQSCACCKAPSPAAAAAAAARKAKDAGGECMHVVRMLELACKSTVHATPGPGVNRHLRKANYHRWGLCCQDCWVLVAQTWHRPCWRAVDLRCLALLDTPR